MDEEGMVDSCQDLSFHHDSFVLPLLLDILLLHRLESKELSSGLLPDQHHLSV